MAPLNNSTVPTSYSRYHSGSLLAPSLAAIIFLVLFFFFAEIGYARNIDSSTQLPVQVKLTQPVLQGQMEQPAPMEPLVNPAAQPLQARSVQY